jgi:7-cyano-7-deazaguanine synthase in queuosine biosynthesis
MSPANAWVVLVSGGWIVVSVPLSHGKATAAFLHVSYGQRTENQAEAFGRQSLSGAASPCLKLDHPNIGGSSLTQAFREQANLERTDIPTSYVPRNAHLLSIATSWGEVWALAVFMPF